MKARGIRSGILVVLEPDDTRDRLGDQLERHAELFVGDVAIEIGRSTPMEAIDLVREAVRSAGGTVTGVRPPTERAASRAETKIIAKTIRSGARVEASGGVVVLGDVNAGAEIVADGDIIVVGTLRGLAHAGASGDPNAVIWARRILSPQLRIGSALAQSGETPDPDVRERPELAHLKDGNIVIRPWT